MVQIYMLAHQQFVKHFYNDKLRKEDFQISHLKNLKIIQTIHEQTKPWVIKAYIGYGTLIIFRIRMSFSWKTQLSWAAMPLLVATKKFFLMKSVLAIAWQHWGLLAWCIPPNFEMNGGDRYCRLLKIILMHHVDHWSIYATKISTFRYSLSLKIFFLVQKWLVFI